MVKVLSYFAEVEHFCCVAMIEHELVCMIKLQETTHLLCAYAYIQVNIKLVICINIISFLILVSFLGLILKSTRYGGGVRAATKIYFGFNLHIFVSES